MNKKSEGKEILVSSSDTFYDDCPICQAMKKAEEEGRELSESELLEAFEKSKEKGAVVGKSKPLEIIKN